MQWIEDFLHRKIRITNERIDHIEAVHPEMSGQVDKIIETMTQPDWLIRSKTDLAVELFYRYYINTPVGDKYMCVVIKNQGNIDSIFMITAYYTDSVKKGEVIWKKV